MWRDARVLELLGRQYWVATPRQLHQAGASEREIRRAVDHDVLERVTRGVVHLKAAPWTFESRAMLLCLAAGPDAYLSGTTAGALWMARGMRQLPVEITIRHARRLVVPDWATVVRSSWLEPEIHQRARADGLQVASPLRCLMRLAESVHPLRFEKAAEDFWHRRLVSPEAAAVFLAAHRRSGRGGVAVFERWLERTSGRERAQQSGLEVELAAALVAFGLPEPQRQFPLQLRGRLTVHLDLAYPEVKLGIEPGASWWHGGDERARADHERDRLCGEVGWQNIRFDEVELRDLERCAMDVVRVFEARRRALRSVA